MIPPIHFFRKACASLLAAGLFLTAHGQAADAEPGAAIFEQKCAQCHGAQGEGAADGYKKPLRGSHTVAELAVLIEETMPEEDPEDCVGEESRLVAEYIHRVLFTRNARLATPRLARLTVDQYRNAVADAIGEFAPTRAVPEPSRGGRSGRRRRRAPAAEEAVPGLRGEYYQSRGMSKADQLGHYRSDTRIDFDFGEESPAASISADQFSIIWEGSLSANDTGHYEFRVTTQNGARLYLNLDPKEGRRKMRDDSSSAGQQALIDAWVGSGKMRERDARVFLLGGRSYPIRLEFFKYLEETASVKLQWKPPHGTWSVLDYNHTTTVRPPRVYVCETPFPADDRSLGYERGSSVSPQWQMAITNAATAAAEEVVGRLPLLAGFNEQTADRAPQVKDFVLRFASMAFRRPLTGSEEKELVEVALAGADNLEAGVRRAIVMVLMSPHFLYTDLTPAGEAPSPYAVTSRLSFGLWDSIPDRELLEAAANGNLESAGQIEEQARRMVSHPRARAKMRRFFQNWLELEERDLAKDKEMFPNFDEGVIADLRRSLELFIEQVVWSPESDYRQLLLADYLVLNERLRDLYQPKRRDDEAGSDRRAIGKAIKERANRLQFASDFQPVEFPARRRSGVLTHPYLLSAYAYHNNTSPIHRGVFLTRNIVGRALNPPPIAVAFKDDEFAPDLTMREKITQLTRDTACMSCHSIINPLGFTLESYDAVGRWRAIDNEKPVDTKSRYTTEDGETLEVASARDVANFAVSSESAHRAFITHVFHHLVKKSPAEFEADLVEQLRARFTDDEFNIQQLWARIAAVTSAHGRAETSAPTENSPATNQGSP